MNPLLHLLPAIYTALTQPAPLVVGALPVPVFEASLPNGFGEDKYVLINEPTLNKRPGARGCMSWSSTVLIDCTTLHRPGEVDGIPADELADQVMARLDEKPLPLTGGYYMSQADAETVNSLTDFDGEQVDVHRYVRMRFTLYYTMPTPVVV